MIIGENYMDNSIFKKENIYRQPVTIEEIKNNIDEIDTIVINGSIEISDDVYDFNRKEMLKEGSIVDLDIIDNKFDIQHQKVA